MKGRKLAVALALTLLLIMVNIPALAQIDTIVNGKYTFTGAVKDGNPCGPGILTTNYETLSVGIYSSIWNANGFCVTVDPDSKVYYPNLMAGFLQNSTFLEMLDMYGYTDANDRRIRFTQCDARGTDSRLFDTITYKSGAIYYGETENGARSGYGLIDFGDGKYKGGLFVEGKLNGWGMILYADGSAYVGQFKDDKADGYVYYCNTKGEVRLCQYSKNEFIGYLNNSAVLTESQMALPPEQLAADLQNPNSAANESGSQASTHHSSSATKKDKGRTCYACSGRGWVNCTHCGGSGYIKSPYHVNDDNSVIYVRTPCYQCNMGKEKCSLCHGTGRID